MEVLDPDTEDPLEQEALENEDVIAGEQLEISECVLGIFSTCSPHGAGNGINTQEKIL